MADAPKASYPSQAGDDALLQEMRERFRASTTYESERRTQQEFDYKFSIGLKSDLESYQWSEDDKKARAGRPMLTNNLIAGQIRRLTNQQRESLQSIRVNPVDNGADPEKAEIRQGVIRHIETRSDADVAYMTAADQQVRMGEGFVRIRPEYVSDDPQNPEQELVIEAIENRFSVYGDPASKKLTGSDSRYWFITEDLEDSEYAKRYSGSMVIGLTEFQGLGDYISDWFLKGSKRVAEYFYVKSTWTKISLKNRQGQTETRDIESRRVCWIKTNGVEVLSRRELPVKVQWIPVVRAAGEKTLVDGKADYRGLTRDAIHAQKKLNYMDSAEAEMIALGSKAPYEGYKGQFTDKKLQTANIKNWPFVEFEARVPGIPDLLPIPKRNVTEPPIQAIVLAASRAENNLRAVLGVVDVESQERRKEQSGKAITARERQSEMSNSHYVRNLGLMVRQVGVVVNAWMESVYDSPRVMQIIGADEQPKTVMVHGKDMPPQQAPDSKVKGVVDLSVGRYDIAIHEGPSAPTARQEAVDNMAQIVTADPAQLKIMGDLFFGSMDSEWARKLAKRYEKIIPAELRGAEGPDVGQLQQQLQQATQMLQALTQELDAKNDFIEKEQHKLNAHKDEKAMDVDAKLEIERMKNETQLAIEKMKIDFQTATALFTAEQERVGMGRMQAHEAALAGQDHEVQTSEADKDRQLQGDEAERGRQHETDMSERGHEQALEQQEAAPSGAGA